MDLELTAVVVPLEGRGVNEAANCTRIIFPVVTLTSGFSNIITHLYQVAAVTRGILFSGAILLSSMRTFERWPAFSSQSRECAVTEAISTSPPKYRDRSQK